MVEGARAGRHSPGGQRSRRTFLTFWAVAGGVERAMSRPLRSTDPSEWAGYTLVSRLGEGGQGVVYLGRGVGGRHVAVKMLHATLIDDERARRRFERELEAARRVDSQCTARVLDAKIDGDVAYIISEYIEGTSLQTSVKLWGPWSGERLEQLAIAM